jgi:hypothetical protein
VDQYNNWVVEVPVGNGTPFAINPTVDGLTLNYPQAAKVDGAGDLFIADTGNGRVVEVPAGGGAAFAINPTVNGSPLNSPQGIAVDGAGNLFISDPYSNNGNGWVVELQQSQPPAISFPTATNVGSTDTTDGTQTVQVANIGNQALTLTALSYPSDFSKASGDANACGSSTSLNAGQSCDLPIQFTPQNSGLLNEDVMLTDNALNVTGTQQSIAVSGTGKALPVAATPTFSPAAGTYSTVQTVTITDITPGAAIYYTTNGSAPTTSSTHYSGAITVSASETLQAIASATGYTTSAVGSAAYIINIPAVLTTPAPGTTLSGTSVNFTWTPGNATYFQLFVGTTGVGSHDVYNSGAVKVTTESVTGLPSNGEKVYVRFYWYINGTWSNADYTYQASGSPAPAKLTTPTSGTTLSGTSVSFSWDPGNATYYQLFVGTTGVGSHDVYNSGAVKVTTESVTVLPSNGEKV